ncbi:antibiotic biosynthesis monooxygenase [Xenorhabdus sp. ZM]|uniref:putative quinol monooxygenase n=1 Tax=Xenorhabdus szentirmaii TaxID=290112 RepID=UPI0019A3D150|nr:antibiotic biosynthesis monooxygenase [Xenorhabdus sp. ZM]MBD2806455.1 antibiotic biosynthesis monooxygenase [Xenorhabdus sp. ZM]
MSINIVVFIKPNISDFRYFGEKLSILREITLQEEGCDVFDFYTFEGKYVLIERWESQECIDLHMNKDYTFSFIDQTRDFVISTEIFRLNNF